MKFSGLYTAIITPFKSDGGLDQEGLRKNIQFQIQNNVKGIVVLGTTGESPTLTSEEKEVILSIAREETKDKIQLIIGTGSFSTEQTISATKKAQKMGADAALIITPYYNKPTQEGLYKHFEAISNASSLPIILYTNPGRTGQSLHLETLKRIASLPTVAGIKECSGNLALISDILGEIVPHHPQFSVLTGDDEFAYPLIALGGHGAIAVTSNLVPSLMNEMIQSALTGDFLQAQKIQFQLRPLYRKLFIETNPIPIKAAMNFLGLAAGSCRLPLCELSPDNQNKLIQFLKLFKLTQPNLIN